MSDSEIQRITENIKDAQKIIDLGSALDRLYSNRDFKKVILEDYFNQESIRLVHLKADSNMQSPERQQSILLQMDAIGSLKQYFITLMRRTDMARKSVESDEQMRDELLADGEE